MISVMMNVCNESQKSVIDGQVLEHVKRAVLMPELAGAGRVEDSDSGTLQLLGKCRFRGGSEGHRVAAMRQKGILMEGYVSLHKFGREGCKSCL